VSCRSIYDIPPRCGKNSHVEIIPVIELIPTSSATILSKNTRAN
jgi:hypothetical protein